MKKTANYQDELIKRLRNPELSLALLNEAMEDEDPRVFLLALRDIIMAHGGIKEISKKTDLSRTSLYKTLSGKTDPHASSLRKLFDSMGIKVTFSWNASKQKLKAVEMLSVESESASQKR